jgi:hypothetical protein
MMDRFFPVFMLLALLSPLAAIAGAIVSFARYRNRVEPDRRIPVGAYVFAVIACGAVAGFFGFGWGIDHACPSVPLVPPSSRYQRTAFLLAGHRQHDSSRRPLPDLHIALITAASRWAGKPWRPYKCALIGHDGKVMAIEDFFALAKRGALARARRIFRRRASECAATELWWERDLLHSERRTPDPKSRA